MSSFLDIANKPINSVLGIDVSTNSLAYCLNRKSGIKTYGEIVFFGATVYERLADAKQKIELELKDLEYDMILFESSVYIQNKATVIILAYANGAVLASLMRPGVFVDDISPLVWQPAIGNKPLTKEEKIAIQEQHPDRSKSWYSGKYREFRKQRTIDWVRETYGLNAATDNIGDAIAISRVGVDKYATD